MKFIWIFIITATFAHSQAYVKVKKNSSTVKEDIGVYITGMSQDKKDWVGIYPIGSSNAWENVVSWKWTDGVNGKTIYLPKILKTGEYEARVFFKDSYKLEATSNTFKVINSGSGTLKLTLPTYHQTTCYRNLIVNFENMGGNYNDWMALYPVKANNDWSNIVLWKWIKNRENGSIDLDPKKNFEVGEYEVRGFFNNTFKLEGTSNPVFITPCNNGARLTTSRKEYFKDEPVVVNFERMSNDHQNWIGIYQKGKKTLAETNLAWKWTGDRTSGQLTFRDLPQGEYDVRAFFNNTYTPQQLTSFKVSGLNANNFPKALLDGSENPTTGVQVKYSKDKNRAYIFIDASQNALFSDKHNGVTAIDNSNKNNPTVIAYSKDQTWRKNSINLTENEQMLTFIDKRVFPHIVVLDINNNLAKIDDYSFQNPDNSNLIKADKLNIFYNTRSWAEQPIHTYFHISEAGVLTKLPIGGGGSDYNFIIDKGTIDNNKYYITYRKRNWDRDDKWESHKKIYDASNLPEIPLIDTIIFDLQP